ncbi:MAG TPA: MraY family glycosyltransferase [Candidatus Acidoferrum sp.]|nr:MraY family glycosyltransferase [Candidatus Acidoferrum sp.]
MFAPIHHLHFFGWFNGLVAFSICAGFLPVICLFAERWKLHDPPGALKIHSAPTARIGGIAIGISLAIGISIGGAGFFSRALGFYLALLVIWAVGLLDDLFTLSVPIRLLAQVSAGLLVALTPWRLSLFSNSFLNVVATCFFVLIFVNSFNFFDGADGLAAGVAGLVGLGYILLYTLHADTVGAAVAWSLFGSCAAFLFFNFPPARIFMGDSGSTALGLVVAFLGLDFYRAHYAIGTHLLLPLVFAGLPLMDFFLAVFRRLRKGVSPFSGDRQHIYDLLRHHGWSARPLALGAYLATGVFLLGGALCDQSNWLFSLFGIALLFGYLLFAAIWLGALR